MLEWILGLAWLVPVVVVMGLIARLALYLHKLVGHMEDPEGLARSVREAVQSAHVAARESDAAAASSGVWTTKIDGDEALEVIASTRGFQTGADERRAPDDDVWRARSREHLARVPGVGPTPSESTASAAKWIIGLGLVAWVVVAWMVAGKGA